MTQGSWRGCPRPRAPASSRSCPTLPTSPARQAHSAPAGAPCASVGPGPRGRVRAALRLLSLSRTLGKVARAEQAGGEEGRREAEAWTRRAATEPAGEVS